MKLPQFDLSELTPGTPDEIPVPSGDFWIFGYGSLMWNPGFNFVDAQPAILYGYHRRLCLWSVRYRGTAEQPGLVLGLDKGGSCQGYAYRVDPTHTATVVNYLCERELLIGSYDSKLVPVRLNGDHRVSALTFISRRQHPHYAPRLSFDQTVSVIRNARGDRGCNTEYVVNTVAHLDQMNIRNTELHRIAYHLVASEKSPSQ